jgi:hypothetical protein
MIKAILELLIRLLLPKYKLAKSRKRRFKQDLRYKTVSHTPSPSPDNFVIDKEFAPTIPRRSRNVEPGKETERSSS